MDDTTINGSKRTTEQLVWAMAEWRKTLGLDPNEITVLDILTYAASASASQWLATRNHVFWQYPNFLMSAIAKARAQGILSKWDM